MGRRKFDQWKTIQTWTVVKSMKNLKKNQGIKQDEQSYFKHENTGWLKLIKNCRYLESTIQVLVFYWKTLNNWIWMKQRISPNMQI